MYDVRLLLTDNHLSDDQFARFLEVATEALALVNQEHARNGMLPPLYESGVVYDFSEGAPQVWRDALEIYSGTRKAACAELAAWRVAELRAQGIPAATRIEQMSGTPIFHVTVVCADGTIEDPSRELGMV